MTLLGATARKKKKSRCRPRQANPVAPVACAFCGELVQTAKHLCYRCPYINSLEDPYIQDSNNLCEEAMNDSQYECLYLRGILAQDLAHIPDTYQPPFEHNVTVKSLGPYSHTSPVGGMVHIMEIGQGEAWQGPSFEKSWM